MGVLKMNGGWNYFLLNYSYGPYDVLCDPNQLPAQLRGAAKRGLKFQGASPFGGISST